MQMCWNISAEEAEQLFCDITRAPSAPGAKGKQPEVSASHVTRQQYLNGMLSDSAARFGNSTCVSI